MKTSITLFLPGLLPEISHQSHVQTLLDFDFNHLSGLIKLLSKANCSKSAPNSIEKSLKSWFSGLGTGEIAAGALGAYHYDLIFDLQENWCRADPIECLVDHKTVYAIGNQHLELTDQEQNSIVKQLNSFLQEDGLSLIPKNDQEWYCRLTKQTDVSTNDLLQVLHKQLLPLLPSGPDQNYWRRLMTECEMLLMQNPVNILRQQQHKPPVSSIWFWGLGALPQNIKTDFEQIISNDSVIGGLAKCAKVPLGDLPPAFDATWLNDPHHLFIADLEFVVCLKHQNWEQWYQRLCHYEAHWFKPLLQYLGEGRLHSLILQCADGCEYKITKKHLKYFFRRNKPLKNFIRIFDVN